MNNDNDKLQQGFDKVTESENPPSFVWKNIASRLEQEDADLLQAGFDKYYEEEEPPQNTWKNIQYKLLNEQTLSSDAPISNNILGIHSSNVQQYSWREGLKKITLIILLLIFTRTCLPETCTPESAMGHSNAYQNNIQLSDLEQYNPNSSTILSSNATTTTSQVILPPTTISKHLAGANSNSNPSSFYKTQSSVLSNIALTNQVYHTSNTTTTEPKTTETALYNPHTISSISTTNRDSNQEEKLDNSIPEKEILNGSAEEKEILIDKTLIPLNIHSIKTDSFVFPLAEIRFDIIEKNKENTASKFPKFELGLISKLGTSVLLGDKTNEGLRQSSLQETQLKTSASVGLLAGLKITQKDAIVAQITPYHSTSQSFGAFSKEGRHYTQVINLSYFDFSLGYERDWFVYDIIQTNNSSIFTRFDFSLSYLLLEQQFVNGEITTSQSFNKWLCSLGIAVGNRHQLNRFVLDYGLSGAVGLNDINNHLSTENQPTNLLHLGGFVSIKYKL